jgi:hypothetical protein
MSGVARFFRRIGLVAEAIAEFRKCMAYSHRYFPEFMLPPLSAAPSAEPAPVTPLYVTTAGDVVVFHEGQYLAVPARLWRGSAGAVTAITADMAAAHGAPATLPCWSRRTRRNDPAGGGARRRLSSTECASCGVTVRHKPHSNLEFASVTWWSSEASQERGFRERSGNRILEICERWFQTGCLSP